MQMALSRLLPSQRALLAHVLSTPAALMLARHAGESAYWPWVEGVMAAAAGAALGLAPWWAIINVSFAPAVQAALTLEFSPLWWLGAFLTLMLVYWSTFRTQVPLYLSNAATLRALVHVLPEKKNFRFVDLGCGVGSVLKGLAHLRGNGDYHGMETAPLPCLAAWWRLRREKHCHVHRRDFWKENLAEYDVVYAFLSPAPMPRLWEKASREMRPGSLFVSNRFIVPGVAPHQRIATGEPGVLLYVWRM